MKRFLTMCAGILLICQFTPPLTLAQNAGYEVKGVVVDKSGMPILGATVVEKGTTNGVSTGIDGDYAIRAAGPESVIEVSYVGYKTVSLVASSSLLAHLTLEEDAMGIDDVVVMGETARQIREQLEEAGYDRITQAYSLRDAVDKARALAVSGGNVLLSPACASFDMFRDYEHRGAVFKEIVNALN